MTHFSFVACVLTQAYKVVPGLDASAFMFTWIRGTSADKIYKLHSGSSEHGDSDVIFLCDESKIPPRSHSCHIAYSLSDLCFSAPDLSRGFMRVGMWDLRAVV